MTDEEIICEWMEPKPVIELADAALNWERGEDPLEDWWVLGADFQWHPRTLDLDALWLVEERLSDAQRGHYTRELGMIPWQWHVTPEQKISALARVLRGGQDGE